MKHLFVILFFTILFPGSGAAGEDGIVVRTAPVFAMASYSSKREGKVEAGTAVIIESRRGGWKRIVSEKESLDGWIRGYQVRETATTPTVRVGDAEEDSRGFLSGLASFSRKASRFFTSDSAGTSSGAATIGVRGLSEAELKSAEADFSALKTMRLYASSKKRSASFATEGNLSAVELPHIGKQEK